MKNLILVIFTFVLAFNSASAQLEPVKWDFKVEKIAEQQYRLHFDATIDKGWVIYGMEQTDGPIPTSIEFEDGAFELTGSVHAHSESTITDDPMFMVELEKFKNEALFSQDVKADEGSLVSGFVTFMTCDGEKCLPPKDIDFSFELK